MMGVRSVFTSSAASFLIRLRIEAADALMRASGSSKQKSQKGWRTRKRKANFHPFQLYSIHLSVATYIYGKE